MTKSYEQYLHNIGCVNVVVVASDVLTSLSLLSQCLYVWVKIYFNLKCIKLHSNPAIVEMFVCLCEPGNVGVNLTSCIWVVLWPKMFAGITQQI